MLWKSVGNRTGLCVTFCTGRGNPVETNGNQKSDVRTSCGNVEIQWNPVETKSGKEGFPQPVENMWK